MWLNVVSSILTLFCQQPSETQKLEKWLGPQTISLSHPLMNLETEANRKDKIPEVACRLEIVRGKDIKLPKSGNPPFTVKEGKFKELHKEDIVDDKLYVYGLVEMKPEYGYYNHYIIRALITDGALKGASVNFLNDTVRRHGYASTASVFEIPSGLNLKEGDKVPFEIRQIYRK